MRKTIKNSLLTRKTKLLLLAIFLLGLFLRVYRLDERMIFRIDQSEDLYSTINVYSHLKSGSLEKISLRGQEGSFFITNIYNAHNPVYTGIDYYFFILPFVVISHYDPVKVTFYFGLLNLLGVFLIYKIVKMLVGSKAGIIASLLYAVSFWMIHYSRVIWTPSPIPFFVLFLFYLLLKIRYGSTHLWPLFAFSASLMTQIHNSGYYYAILFAVMLIAFKVNQPKNFRNIFITVLSGMVPIVPTILQEVKTGFKLFPSIYFAFIYQFTKNGYTSGDNIYFSMLKTFGNLLKTYLDFWVTAINPLQYFYELKDFRLYLSVPFLIFSVILIVSSLLILRKRRDYRISSWIFIFTFIFIPFFSKIYYMDISLGLRSGGSSFAVIGGIPFVLIFLSIFLTNVVKNDVVIGIFVLLYTVVNIYALRWYVFDNNDQIFDYGEKEALVRGITQDSKGVRYNLFFNDTFEEGYSMFYIYDYFGFPRPANYTQVPSQMKVYRYATGYEDGVLYYQVVDVNKISDLAQEWKSVFTTGRYRVYKLEE